MGCSVVIPAYNAGAFIREAVESVEGADEIIVVNDGSTDFDYDSLHCRVIHQANRGVSAARNAGCDAARSEYVAILDADDVWLPGKLARQMAYLKANPEIDACFALGRFWDGGARPAVREEPYDPKPLYYRDMLCTPMAVYPSTMVVRRSVWKEIGGFKEGMKKGEDWDFYLRLAHGHRITLLPFPAMLYRQHAGSVSAKIDERNAQAEMLKSIIGRLGLTDAFGVSVDQAKLRQRLARTHFMHGYDHFWSGCRKVAFREFSEVVRLEVSAKSMAYVALSAVTSMVQVIADYISQS